MSFQLAARISLRRVGFNLSESSVDNIFGENMFGKKYRGQKTMVPRFFNRIMGLPTVQQNLLSDWFIDTHDEVVVEAKRTGKWDGPMRHIRGPNVTFKVMPFSYLLFEIHVCYPIHSCRR